MDLIPHSQIIFNEQLLSLIEEGENERVQEILKLSHLYHSIDALGATLLHYSVRHGNTSITQFLLNNGCHINAQDLDGNTPLMVAVRENHESVVEILLHAGADILFLNHENKSALHLLCTNERITTGICKVLIRDFRKKCSTSEEAAKKLIDAGFDVYLAAYSLDSKIIEYMLERGYPVDSMHPADKYTAMHIAVDLDDLSTIKVLLKYGADAKALDANGASPLHYLYRGDRKITRSKVEILEILLNIGASPTSCSNEGYFDIGYTLVRGDREAISVVLKLKLDFTAVDKINGRTILHYLAQNTNPGIDKELDFYENAEYHVNAVDKIGYSLLSLAAINGNADMVICLLRMQAFCNTRKQPPLYYAYTRSTPRLQDQYDQCAEFLLQNNADLQAVLIKGDGEKSSLFEVACGTNDLKKMKAAVAQILLRSKMGRPITEKSLDKINSNSVLKEYFTQCQPLLDEKIFGSVTFASLLNCNYRKIARYLDNRELLRKTKLFIRRRKLKSLHTYLYNTWTSRYSNGKNYRIVEHLAIESLCKIFGYCVDKNHLIIHSIIKYLDDLSVLKLAELS